MIGLVIVTHGRLAEEFRRALEHVVGPQRGVETVCIGPEDDPETCMAEVRRRVQAVETGDGVVLLTDMFGGTPSNTCIAQMARPGVEVLGGVNLPLLVKLAKVRSALTLPDAVSAAQAAGRKYIASASDVLPNCRGHGVAAPSVVPAPGIFPQGAAAAVLPPPVSPLRPPAGPPADRRG